MSNTTNRLGPEETVKRDFRVKMLYHPSHHVPDLGEAERWFERVFGRRSTSLASMTAVTGRPPGIPHRLSRRSRRSATCCSTPSTQSDMCSSATALPDCRAAAPEWIRLVPPRTAEVYRELRRYGSRSSATRRARRGVTSLRLQPARRCRSTSRTRGRWACATISSPDPLSPSIPGLRRAGRCRRCRTMTP